MAQARTDHSAGPASALVADSLYGAYALRLGQWVGKGVLLRS